MRLPLSYIINSHKGKTAIIVGLAPSAAKDIPNIDYGKHIVIACNDFDQMIPNLKPHFWVHANSYDTIKKNYMRYNKYNAIIAYADSVDLTPKEDVENLLSVHYIPYDQRHFKNEKCKNKDAVCCHHIEKGRLTIQEELKKYTNHHSQYGTGDTVALHMLSLALLIGCEKIYIIGVDLDYSKGYICGKKIDYIQNNFHQYMPRLMNDFSIINESAKNIGVEIFITHSETPLVNIFEIKQIYSENRYCSR